MEQKLVKVPFEVNLAKEISNGTKEGKVVTRDDGNARIICWDAEGDQPIIALIKYHDKEYPHSFYQNGSLHDGDSLNGDLMLEIPEHMTFKDGDVVVTEDLIVVIRNPKMDDLNGFCFRLYVAYNCKKKNLLYCADFINQEKVRFATEEEKQILVERLKASKQPKDKEYLKRFFNIEVKPECEFKPFDKVLVRDEGGTWFADIFSHYSNNSDYEYKTAGGGSWEYCIPYNEKTAHLIGTTDNWEG